MIADHTPKNLHPPLLTLDPALARPPNMAYFETWVRSCPTPRIGPARACVGPCGPAWARPGECFIGNNLLLFIVIFVFVILMLIGILVSNDLMPDIGSTDGLEIKDYKTNSQLNNIYWLLIIVIILLSIILWKIW